MGDDTLAKVMAGEMENAGQRGLGRRGRNVRAAWQRIDESLASRGTGVPPH